MRTWISKSYLNTHFGKRPSLDGQIAIFVDRVLGWQIEIAEAMDRIPHAGYGIVSVLFSYFEMIAQYQAGLPSDYKSGEFFRRGFRSVFPRSRMTNAKIGTVYKTVRCGMYHDGYTRIGVLLSGDYRAAVSVRKGRVLINPHLLTPVIRRHFLDYARTLSDPTRKTERDNFEKIFKTGLGL